MSKLIFLIGYSCSGKTTALNWIKEAFFPKCFCFDVGEVIRDWASMHGWPQNSWPRLSISKERREGFDWIFWHAGVISGKSRLKRNCPVFISGNRIFNLDTTLGPLNFIDAAKKFYVKREAKILYIRASAKVRYLRNRLRNSKWSLTMNEFLYNDRLDRNLGLSKLIYRSDFVIDNEGSLRQFRDEILHIIGKCIYE